MTKKVFSVGLIFLLITTTLNLHAQDDKYGDNPNECKRNLSLYKEFLKQKNYKDAYVPWNWCFNNCPQSTKNIYIDGVKLMYNKIKKSDNDETKSAYIDTLLMVYEQRIQYFGSENFVKGRMGVDILRFRPDDVEKAYEYLKVAAQNNGRKTEEAVAITFMQSSAFLFKNEIIESEQVLEDFATAMSAMKTRNEYYTAKGQTKKIAKINKAIAAIEQHFMDSGAANCDELIEYFKPKYDANPEDVELLEKITKLLRKSDCTDGDLFYDAAKSLYRLAPSAEAAYNIAKLALKREEFKESAKYYLEAIEKQTDKLEKSNYYYELGLITYSQLGDYEKARSYAYKSFELNPASGKPYLLIGDIYAASAKRCGEDDFHQRAVYWVAVDKYYAAIKIDPSIKEDANRRITSWSQHFPNKELGFFYGVNEGDEYTVGCWINEKTKARYN